MMSDRLDDILMQALTPEEEPAEELNQRILRRIKEEEQNMEDYEEQKVEGRRLGYKVRGRIPAAVLIAVLVLGGISASAFAAAKLLWPSEVTQMLGDEKLTEAFLGDDAVIVNETQSIGGYDVTFMGIASGKGISDGGFYCNGELREERSYAVVSIAHADGVPMPEVSSDEYSISDFFVSPLIQGCDPVRYNAVTFGGAGAVEDVVDGVRYRVMECDNIEIFADRELYLCVLDNTFYEKGAYHYDEESGRITRNESYEGLNALFTLPIDRAKAEPEAAKAYLESMQEEASADSAGMETPDGENSVTGNGEKTEEELLQEQEELMRQYWGENYETYRAVEEWCSNLTPDNLNEYAVPVESTRQIIPIDEEGYISDWNYEVEGRSSGSGGKTKADWLFKHADPENPVSISYNSSGTMDTVVIETLTLNGDGTVTFVAYIPKEN